MGRILSLIAMIVVLSTQWTIAQAGSLSEEQLRKEISRQIDRNNLKVSEEEVSSIIDALFEGFNVDRTDRLPINGVLSTSGVSAALLVDRDVWKLDGGIVSEQGELINIDNLFEIYYNNSGLKAELAYKYMFIFIPDEVSTAEALDGAIYGGFMNGLGLDFELGIGVEIGWLNAVNRPGQVFVIGGKVGVGGGISFPKMEFRLRTRPEVRGFPWHAIIP